METRRAKQLSMLGIVLLAFMCLATAAWAASMEFEGRVISVSGEQVALYSGDQQYMIRVNSNTKITLDGAEATLDRITPGDMARVSADADGEIWVASVIEATSQPGPAN